MNKTYSIFRHEFIHTIKKTGFLIMTFIVPVLALLGILFLKLATPAPNTVEKVVETIGYVDQSGTFTHKNIHESIKLVLYSSKEEATRALFRQEINEFIIIPPNYVSSGRIERFTSKKELETPSRKAALMKIFLNVNLLKGKVPPEILTRVVTPLNLTVTRITEQGGVAQKKGNAGKIIIVGAFSLLLSLALMLGATGLIYGLGEEKESRLIEVLFSSVSVRQLLSGKVMALGTAGLLQVLVWLISAPILLSLASSTLGGFMNQIELPGNFILLGSIYFILGYLLFAVLSVGVGAISSGAKEGSQLSLIYTLTGFVPLWFAGLFFITPYSPIWVVLTIFPVTAPVQTMLRLGVSEIPFWQIIVSTGVLCLSIIIGMILSVKIFRVHMLMHGKRPTLKEIFRNLKNS